MLSIETRLEIEHRALEIQAEIEAKSGPYSASVIEGEVAAWHLVRSTPTFENKAAQFLSDRGFGIYLPMKNEWRVTRGRKRLKTELFFPGYLFLFVWDVKAHWRRIIGCPGVQTVLCIEERPIVVPDAVIDYLQRLELRKDAVVAASLGSSIGNTGGEPAKKKARWRRKPKTMEERYAEHMESEQMPSNEVTSSTKSYWNEMVDVDSQVRIGALHRALGLVS